MSQPLHQAMHRAAAVHPTAILTPCLFMAPLQSGRLGLPTGAAAVHAVDRADGHGLIVAAYTVRRWAGVARLLHSPAWVSGQTACLPGSAAQLPAPLATPFDRPPFYLPLPVLAVSYSLSYPLLPVLYPSYGSVS